MTLVIGHMRIHAHIFKYMKIPGTYPMYLSFFIQKKKISVSFFIYYTMCFNFFTCHVIDVLSVLWSIWTLIHAETQIRLNQINAELLITAMIKEFTYKNSSPTMSQ